MADDDNLSDLAERRATAAAEALAQRCSQLRYAGPRPRVGLNEMMSILMMELFDRFFTQTEIRTAFEGAVAEMSTYAGGEEQRY